MRHERQRVVFQKWRWSLSYCPSKSIAVDKQADDEVVHLYRFREADCLSDQAFDPRPKRQMLTLDLLGILFAWAMHVGVQIPGVCAPMIRIETGQPKGLEQCFEL